MMLTKYLIDAIDLSTLPGINYAPGTSLQPAISRRREEVTVRHRDGVTLPPLPPLYGPRQMTLNVHVNSNLTGSARESELATRSADVAARLAGATLLTRAHGAQSLITECELQELVETDADRPHLTRTLTATYRLPKVFFRGPRVSIAITPPETQAGQVVEATRQGAFAPVSDTQVTIVGPAGYVRITDGLSGEWLEWSGMLPAGQTLIIDYATDTAKIGNLDVSNAIDSSPYGARLYPMPTGRIAARIVRTGGTGAVTLSYSPHYF